MRFDDLQHRCTITVRVREFLQFAAAAAAIVYVVGLLSLYAWFQDKPYNKVGLPDVMLPWHWSRIAELRGEAEIEEGRANLKAGRIEDGILKLKSGLGRNPSDTEARLELARTYVQRTSIGDALAIMQLGFGYGYPSAKYLESFFSWAQQVEDYSAIISTCDRLLLRREANAPDLLVRKAKAWVALGRDNEAIALSNDSRIAGSPSAREVRVLALIDQARWPEAKTALEDWLKLQSDSLRAQELLVKVLREVGDTAGMESTLRSLASASSQNVEAAIYLISQRWLAGQQAEALHAFESYFIQMNPNAAQFTAAAVSFAALPSSSLVERCLDVQSNISASSYDIRFLLAKVYALEGKLADAEHVYRQLPPLAQNQSALDRQSRRWFERVLAEAIAGSTGEETELFGFLRENQLPPRFYRETMQIMEFASRKRVAMKVGEIGLGTFPENKFFKGKVAELRGQAASDQPRRPVSRPPENQPRPVRPSTADLKTVERLDYVKLGPEDFWALTDNLIAERRWDDAARVLHDLDRAAPVWLGKSQGELEWRKARVAFGQGDTGGVLLIVRRRLERSPSEASRAFEFAKEYRKLGDRTAALRVALEIQKRVPNFGPVHVFIAEANNAPVSPPK